MNTYDEKVLDSRAPRTSANSFLTVGRACAVTGKGSDVPRSKGLSFGDVRRDHGTEMDLCVRVGRAMPERSLRREMTRRARVTEVTTQIRAMVTMMKRMAQDGRTRVGEVVGVTMLMAGILEADVVACVGWMIRWS